ncbi:uncharacterized protein LOC131356316 [Hemibagrus wyckioides]|uniref:uncharacterized protein LOC131356316 n=1 Tax=Hemibagrus wyckioides TaxID=337641 RepID=UPI00266C1E4C|nr:uncharacterized protein LOC131356316 [Hemibagrus wyckioides]
MAPRLIRIRTNPYKYAEAVKIQNKFNYTNSSNQFKIEAGIRKGDKEKFIEYKKKNKNDEDKIIEECQLGEAGEYRKLINKEKPTPGVVEADHIPPRSSLQKLCKILKNNPEKAESFKRNNKALYDLVTEEDKKMKNNNKMDEDYGRHLLSMNALHWDHRRALTTGNSSESRACRDLLTETFEKDVEKGLKLSLIMAHPQTSDYIREKMNRTRKSSNKDYGLTAESTRKYYKQGFENIIKEYEKKNVINQNQADDLKEWVKNERYLCRNAQKHVKEITGFYKQHNTRTLPSHSRGQGSIPTQGNNTDTVGLTLSARPNLRENRKGVAKSKSARKPVPEKHSDRKTKREL